jgi:hypothetical protein
MPRLPSRRSVLTLAVAAPLLASCNELGESVAGAQQPKVNAPGVPIAVESITGAPEEVQGQFSNALVAEATARQVELVGSDKKVRFRIRGYLDAHGTADGKTALAFVWDVFDTQKRRAQRLQGEALKAGASGANAWAQVDQATVNRAAADSMNAIAGFLAAAGPSA